MELERLHLAAVQRAEDRLSAARDNLESASLAQVKSESVTKQTYMVIDQPEIPQVAEISTKTMAVNFAIFVVVGIFLSVVAIAGGALLDRSLRFPIDVRHGLSLPVLAMVPTAKPILVAATADIGVASTSTAVVTEDATLQPQT
ncbi:lipopolysaccharide biosynthesis protein [Oscillochloris trichoides DG-6]|uniref:Lipopolysaccharide biosynthesis protein n=1 Tax=Oscillochloris trichoides DG-6 TaxID=765420 RepID=E1I9K0_9CHLR|nr:lipopolysaccharide biosynthesis protein [Oscillochloris trichoides DG-6]